MREEIAAGFYPGFEDRWRRAELAGRWLMLAFVAPEEAEGADDHEGQHQPASGELRPAPAILEAGIEVEDRWRRAELAGRWLMLAFVVVCALGLLGRGPLSEGCAR
jgi:hypothetical protein